MRYQKPPLTVDQQLVRFQQRGMVIADPTAAKLALERISYYRFSAYALPWRNPTNHSVYLPGITFDRVLAHYEFDRVLRNFVWEAIEPIEVALRTRITQHLSITYGTFVHTDHRQFVPTKPPHWDHAKWLAKVEEEAERSHEIFIDHYKKKYSGFPQLPLWMATEIMSFGSLSKLYGAMLSRDQRAVARSLNLNEAYLPSWFHTISVIRNTCAHHGRLWDRGLGVKPALPQQAVWQTPSIQHKDRLGCVLLMLNYLLRETATPCRQVWADAVRAHVAPMIPDWGIRMGLPANWDNHPLWF